MGVSDRWVRKLLKRMSKQGDAVVVHGLRGRPSNRKLPAETQRQALEILKQPDWHDFGPTFAAEQLAKRHRIQVGKETLREVDDRGRTVEEQVAPAGRGAWLAAAAKRLWRTGAVGHLRARLAGRKRAGALPGADDRRRHQLELGPLRRARCDTAQHGCAVGVPGEEWPDGGRLHGSRFDVHRTATRLEKAKSKQREADRLTQLGRALRELGIGSILAYSPQAKGRIERSFLTAQDRLVKHLRLAKVSTLEAANAFLENEYWPEWNAHFARPVADFPNQHRALTPQLDLAAILCHVEERVIGNDYTFSFAGRRYQIERTAVQAGMRRQRLRVELRLDGELKARYQGRYVEIGECGMRADRCASRRRANRFAKITMREAGVAGCRASSIAPARRCGRRSETETQKPISAPGKPGACVFMPKASAREFHQSNGSQHESPPGAPERLTRF